MDKRDQLSLFGIGPDTPRDEVEPAPPPPARRGSAPRRFLVQLLADDERSSEALAQLREAATALSEDARVVTLDPQRDLVWSDLSFLAVDTETTGLDPSKGRVIEVGWVRTDRGEETDAAAHLCGIDEPIEESVARITGISTSMVRGQPPFAETAPALVEAMASVDFIAAYNAAFDRAFLARELALCGLTLPEVPWVDPLVFIREIDRYKSGKKLSDASRRWGVALDSPHRALADARATARLLLSVAPYLPSRSLADLLDQQRRWAARQLQDAPERRRPKSEDDSR